MEEKTIAGPYCPPSIGMLLIIVGTRFYTPAKELEGYLSEAPKHKMKLEAEPYNKFDPLAVKVLDCQGEERLIGYIRSEDTRKAHFLMKLYNDTQIYLHVVGLVPGANTSLVAYPVINGKELKLFKRSDIPANLIPQDNFSKLIVRLDTIPTERKETLYFCLTYLRDKCLWSIPQPTLTAILESIEHDKYSIKANSSAPTLKVDGGISQLAFGNGSLTNNH